jgi:hypothetical protein
MSSSTGMKAILLVMTGGTDRGGGGSKAPAPITVTQRG